MPIFDPNGRPLGAAPIVGAKKLTDYPALTDEEMKVVINQLEQAVSHGIPDEVPVTIATGILIRLVRRAQDLATQQNDTPKVEMPWLTPMPEGRQVTLPPEFFKQDDEATDSE
jgi:hypothetical protein